MSMSGGKISDRVIIELKNRSNGDLLPVYIEIFDNSLSRKWLHALNDLLRNGYHLEKNYCFFGFVDHERDGAYLLDQINQSINSINLANLGYHIDDHFSMENCFVDTGQPLNRDICQPKFNMLHRYFEDLQGVSGNMSSYFTKADPETRWHIRQLNLLCHEFESWALSYRKQIEDPEWMRPSQLMCWLNAPRFVLEDADLEFFGINTINRPLGGITVGVNKAIGKHHWEVFCDEGKKSRINELVSSTMRSQTEASGDFDIEWGNNPGNYHWQKNKLQEFRQWLSNNGFDPNDPNLTLGHPQVGQVDLKRSFESDNYVDIWKMLSQHLDVYSVKTSEHRTVYDYHWKDRDFKHRQVEILGRSK